MNGIGRDHLFYKRDANLVVRHMDEFRKQPRSKSGKACPVGHATPYFRLATYHGQTILESTQTKNSPCTMQDVEILHLEHPRKLIREIIEVVFDLAVLR
jgi:hypothetical protein